MCVCVCESESCSVMSNSLQPHEACQALLSMEFSRQEYWSGLPFPSPGDFSDIGIKPRSPALQTDSLPSEPPGKPNMCLMYVHILSTFLYMYTYTHTHTIFQLGHLLKLLHTQNCLSQS